MAILSPGSAAQELGYSISLITVNALGAIANFILLLMFFRFRRKLLKKTKNILLLSMTIADFLVGISGILGGVLFHLYATKRSTVTNYKIGGLLPLFASFFMSMLSLGIITADRLVSVKFPVKYNLIMNRRKAIMLIVGSWIIVSCLMTMQGILFFTVSKLTELRTRGSLLGIFFVISSIILSVTNAYLFMMLRRIAAKKAARLSAFQPIELHSKNADLKKCNNEKKQATKELTNTEKKYDTSTGISKSSDGDQPAKDNIQFEGTTLPVSSPYVIDVQKGKKKKPADKGNSMICICMTVVFIVCWFPAAVFYVMWAITGKSPGERTILAFVLCLASSNSLMNPIIYFVNRKDFRQFILETLLIRQKTTDMESSGTRTTNT